MTLQCKICGNPLRDEDQFCPHCGTKVMVDCCPFCGSSIRPGDIYCGVCGHYLKSDQQTGAVHNSSLSANNQRIPSEQERVSDSRLQDMVGKRTKRLGAFQRHRLSLGIAALEILVFIILSPVHNVTSIAFSRVAGFVLGMALVYIIGIIPFAFSLKKFGICSHGHIGLWFLGTCDVLVFMAPSWKFRVASGKLTFWVIIIGILSLILSMLYQRYQKRE